MIRTLAIQKEINHRRTNMLYWMSLTPQEQYDQTLCREEKTIVGKIKKYWLAFKLLNEIKYG